MTRRRAGALVLLCTLSTLWITSVATARPPSPPATLTAADFHPIVLGTGVGAEDTGSAAVQTRFVPARIADFAESAVSGASRPTPKQSAPIRTVSKAPTQFKATSTGKHVAGAATWYCKSGSSPCHAGYPGGMYAAAGPELRVGSWHGRVVRVCAGGRCVNVKLVDWCACGGSHMIDLYSDAFRVLAPLDSGSLRVTVRW